MNCERAQNQSVLASPGACHQIVIQQEAHEDTECTHLFRSARQLGARGVEGDGSQGPLMGSNGADRFLSVKRQDGH